MYFILFFCALQEKPTKGRLFHHQKNVAELEERCEYPWRDLFLWAVLQNRQQMANYFWAMVSLCQLLLSAHLLHAVSECCVVQSIKVQMCLALANTDETWLKGSAELFSTSLYAEFSVTKSDVVLHRCRSVMSYENATPDKRRANCVLFMSWGKH